MKKIVFIHLLILLLCLSAVGQEFSFEMIFIDAVGDADTIVIGYDPLATDSVDTKFGEINIIDTELDSVFDVRITNEWKVRAWAGYEYRSKYHLKKQIVKKNCVTWSDPVSIDIKCSHWPVTAKWDSTLFSGDHCLEGSVFTSLHPGLWWDVMTPSDLFYRILSDNVEVKFTSNTNGSFDPGGLGENSYINPNNDTIPVFWVALGTTAIWTDININAYENDVVLSPNPSHSYLRIDSENIAKIRSIEVYDIMGSKPYIPIHGNNIDVGKLKDGAYFVKIIFCDNLILVKKFIKY